MVKNDTLVTAEEALLIKLLRMRTDVGHMAMSRILTGGYQASFKIFNGKGYRAALALDPISALVEVLGPKDGQSLDDLPEIARKQTPEFDLANTPKKLIEEEAARAGLQGRMPAQLLSDIVRAQKSGKFIGEVKGKPEIDPLDDTSAPVAKPKKRAVDDDLL